MNVLCAGAAQGLVKALQGVFLEFTGARIHSTFGAVGVLRDAFLAGDPCDVLIVTAPLVAELEATGRLMPGSEGMLGRVRTALAMRGESPRPDVSTPESLKATLLAASVIYCPDIQRSTAGAHFGSVLRELGITDLIAPRLRCLPNGTDAMRELAADPSPGAIGCAQATQIRYTPGISLLGALPQQFELAMVYSAAVSANAAQPEQARRFVELMSGARTRVMRTQVGFEAVMPASAPDTHCAPLTVGAGFGLAQGEAGARTAGLFR
ncbi:substrate-binding domain-containing protein [Variovorax sp. OV329]|uniref:molybdate ABC transporter substrate-binding protein n=1 Tax=Variovorax sp. OV329 TaxID=1882825 RepID=UPI0008E643B1|nr:substrate-binding domain-containing protein [Variovorax sp. OV329]SFN37532.1 molybdate transport system substrate-binding protein [Variovorax sp. OV329]